MDEEHGVPRCMKCGEGRLLPLSGRGGDGSALRYRAWVCSNPECGFNLRIDDGEISFGRSLSSTLA